MDNIVKSFAGIKALNDVHLDLREGELHALMGENGAGKSTLMKILTGVYSKDSGTIKLRSLFYILCSRRTPDSPITKPDIPSTA